MIEPIPNVVLAPLITGIMPAVPMPIEFPVNPITGWLVVLAALVLACAALYFVNRLSRPLKRERHLRVLRPSTTPQPLTGQA